MSPRELTAGQMIADRYRLIALRGSGGMGSVWRALHLPDQRECALKILHRSSPDHGALLTERFLREARAASSIDSPHAVRVLDYGMHAEIPFIAMELLEGETLAARLQAEGRLDPLATSRVIDHVARALDRAHELGIVHRDLKPENVFLARGEHGMVAKVLDFGIAKLHDDEALARDLTQTGALLGTPHYMSPEQVEGARYVDHRADLWSLGVLAYECITGERPFKGDGLRALFGAICLGAAPAPSTLCNVPRGFDGWFARATQKDPARRFRSAGELASALQRVCEQELALTATADEPGAPEPSATAASRAPRQAVRPLAPAPRVRAGGSAVRWIVAGAVLVALAGWLSARLLSGSPEPLASPTMAPAPARPPVADPPEQSPAPTAALPATATAAAASEGGVQAPPRARVLAPEPPRVHRSRRAREPEPPSTRGAAAATAPARWDVDLMLRDRK